MFNANCSKIHKQFLKLLYAEQQEFFLKVLIFLLYISINFSEVKDNGKNQTKTYGC